MTTQSSWKQSRSNAQMYILKYINMFHQLCAQHKIANASQQIFCCFASAFRWTLWSFIDQKYDRVHAPGAKIKFKYTWKAHTLTDNKKQKVLWPIYFI